MSVKKKVSGIFGLWMPAPTAFALKKKKMSVLQSWTLTGHIPGFLEAGSKSLTVFLMGPTNADMLPAYAYPNLFLPRH